MASLLLLSLCVGMISAFQHRVLGPTCGSKLGTTGRRVPTMSMSEAPSATTFDMDLAIALGAHAFDVYNDPRKGEGKKCTGIDKTSITMSGSEFIQRTFDGLLMGTLKKGQFRNEKEEEFTERIVSGGQPDLYVNMHIEEEDSSRVLESYRSSVKPNNNMPEWCEGFSFYIRDDPSKATLKINVFDEDVLSEDDYIGSGEIRLEQLLANARENKKSLIEVPVPIYEDKKKGWFGLGGGKQRKGTVMLELQFVRFASDSSTEGTSNHKIKNKMRAPKGASPGEADWEELVTRRIEECIDAGGPEGSSKGEALMCSMGGGLHKICSLDNSQTDTQASIWADFHSRQMVLSFRGTEQIKIKDVLTDINLVQARYFPGAIERCPWGSVGGSDEAEDVDRADLRQVLIHKGFLSAFRSIEPAVLQLLWMIMAPDKTSSDSDGGADEKPWTIHITGHSLGGALASLMTFDLARIMRGYYLGRETAQKGSLDAEPGLFESLFSDQWQDPAPAFMSEHGQIKGRRAPSSLVSSLRRAHILTYTYGAPRVGNPRFSQLSDRIAPHHYRVVNDKDVVPRVPRSSMANRLLEYSHAGKTVAVATNGTKDAIWIEGQSQGTSPTQEVSPFADKYAGMGLPSALFAPSLSPGSGSSGTDSSSATEQEQELFDFEEQVASLLALHPATASEALSSIADRALSSGQSLLMSKLPDVLEAAGVGEEDLRQLDGLFKTARELSGGVQSQFIEREFEMLASILDSRALSHHLEPSYFEALLAQAGTEASPRKG